VVEQPIRNRQVVGSTPTLGSTPKSFITAPFCMFSVHASLGTRWKVVGSFAEFGFEHVHRLHLRFCDALDVDVDREAHVAVPQDGFVVHA
jgi:hypothetical protein